MQRTLLRDASCSTLIAHTHHQSRASLFRLCSVVHCVHQGVEETLLAARRYVAEHVAFTAATDGYQQLAQKRDHPPYDRRALIRLVDLATGLLPDADDGAADLRDRMCAR